MSTPQHPIMEQTGSGTKGGHSQGSAFSSTKGGHHNNSNVLKETTEEFDQIGQHDAWGNKKISDTYSK
ncbi:hypothetical protein G7054_g3686 [Neopestalotiopsis clavispora]|nr:hypothetical protein G7054_g3686 [Neopestalotiopsis clavispora]